MRKYLIFSILITALVSVACENNIKYEYLNVADIALIPGIIPLFYSNWDTYLDAAQAFVAEYPEFKEYLNN